MIVTGENRSSRCRLIHHKSHVGWRGIEPGYPRCGPRSSQRDYEVHRSLNTASDSHKSRSLQQQHDGRPSICELAACQKLLITSRAPVPVPLLSYTVLTFVKGRIPPHTSAHKHGTRKDISVLCKEGEHLEPHDVIVWHG